MCCFGSFLSNCHVDFKLKGLLKLVLNTLVKLKLDDTSSESLQCEYNKRVYFYTRGFICIKGGQRTGSGLSAAECVIPFVQIKSQSNITDNYTYITSNTTILGGQWMRYQQINIPVWSKKGLATTIG